MTSSSRTSRIDGPFTAFAAGAKAARNKPAPSPIHEGDIEGPFYNFVYFFEDGGVSRLHTKQPDSILMQQAYMVMVSVPRTGSAAPYVEIIKSRLGPSSLIMSADVQSS